MQAQPSNMAVRHNLGMGTLNTDLRLIKEYSHPIIEQRICAPKNVRELGNLLRQKNQGSQRTKEEKERGQGWLREKRVDMRPLIEKIESIKQINQKHHQQRTLKQDSYFYMEQITLQNYQEYLAKANQLAMFGIMQSLMTTRNTKRKFDQKLMKLLSQGEKQPLKMKGITVKHRSEEKKHTYIDCVKRFTNFQDKKGIIKCFKQAIHIELWEFMFKQIKDADIYSTKVPVYRSLLLNSLNTVQGIFNEKLPPNNESLQYYLHTQYLSKLQKYPYMADNDSGAVWGKAFLLYRAGRKKQFYGLLQHKKGSMLSEFVQTDQSIVARNPIPSSLEFETGQDVFMDQLIYALRGEPKYSSPVLCNPSSLDIVWVILRNIGIFKDGRSDKFMEFRRDLIQSYKASQNNYDELQNMIHLLAYEQLIEVGTNQIMDRDDYLHFLISLKQWPQLLNLHNMQIQQQSIVQNKLNKALVQSLLSFIHELRAEKRQQAYYYMILLPQTDREAQISSIFGSMVEWEDHAWKFFKRHLKNDSYYSILKRTIEKHISRHQNYFLAAKKARELLQDNQTAIEYLIHLLISQLSFETESQELAMSIFKETPALSKKYHRLITFLSLHRKLIQLIIERNSSKISQFIQQKKPFLNCLFQQTFHYQNKQMLKYLIQFKGAEVYFKLMKNLVKAAEIMFLKEKVQLKQFYQVVYKCVNEVIKSELFIQYREYPIVDNLLDFLTKSLQQI